MLKNILEQKEKVYDQEAMQSFLQSLVDKVIEAESNGVIPDASCIHICPDATWIAKEFAQVEHNEFRRLPPTEKQTIICL